MAMVKKSERHEEYVKMRKRGDKVGDTNDCSVIATALAADISYDEARKLYKAAGRQDRNGVSCLQIDRAMDRLSSGHRVKSKRYEMEDMIPLYENIYAKTLTFNNISKVLDKEKRYVVIGVDHMAAFRDGRIADWSEGTKRHVKNIYEILK
jgi:hypothetical protein